MGFVEALRKAIQDIRAEREAATGQKIKRIQIAALADKSEAALSKFENGKTETPDGLSRVIDAYAQAFGVRPSEIIGRVHLYMEEDDDRPHNPEHNDYEVNRA